MAILFAASVEEARGGIFTSRGASCLPEGFAMVFAVGDCEEGGAGLEGAMDALASRLVA